MNVETALDILRHPRRRAVVSILNEVDSISRHELVDRLAAADADIGDEGTEVGDDIGARAVDVALHHNHLPRLADARVVEYDGDTVTATPQLETVVEYATVVGEESTGTRHRLSARLSHFYA